MDGVEQLIASILVEHPPQETETEQDMAERRARERLIFRLFTHWQVSNTDQATRYLDLTEEIPILFLWVAIEDLYRTHPYQNIPMPADIFARAREAAGVGREQYVVGPGTSYVPIKDWPPFGLRHGPVRGKYEPIGKSNLIGAGSGVMKVLALTEANEVTEQREGRGVEK